MKNKKLSHLIAASFLCFAMLACNIGKNPSSNGSQDPANSNSPAATDAPAGNSVVAGGCENQYYPVKAGITWSYKMTGTASDTITRSILTTDAAGFTDQDVFGAGVTRQSQWQCDNGNLTALNDGNGVSSSVSTANVTADFHTTEQSGVTIPAVINAGDTWTQSITVEGNENINGQQIPAKNQTTNSCTAVGIESITVDAGTFDAMRVDCQTTINITITMGTSQVPTSIATNSSNWYAPNIGLVKTVATGSNLDSTMILTSYTIP